MRQSFGSCLLVKYRNNFNAMFSFIVTLYSTPFPMGSGKMLLHGYGFQILSFFIFFSFILNALGPSKNFVVQCFKILQKDLK